MWLSFKLCYSKEGFSGQGREMKGAANTAIVVEAEDMYVYPMYLMLSG